MEVQELANKIPASAELEKRFNFIGNDILRSNIALAFQYVTFLLTLINKGKIQGTIIFSIYKNIILYTACIVESCIHYILREYVEAGVINSSDVMPFEWKYKNVKEICQISSGEKAIGGIKYKSYERMQNNIQFQTLNKAAKNAGIFNESLFKKADKVREERNKIHLAGLNKVEDYYCKEDVDNIFNIAKDIIERVESKTQILHKNE